ncbi:MULTISPECIES: UbiD family decarboxylase [Prochlorococcus]|uniref:3-polyprenyl-4-hydroxybenzoate decarboxylase elated enzyme n=1 Tax=Prochlorococcus marinus (strain SARG / CCMP1375 / SS120) TaxID=167539 RepID=Q7VBP5_PROMA|nr:MULTISPECIES: UbiD family decarboxylase [Prochlorococcus]AAQ00092.1 3-polyprenyl-4-hydroxybenzoate decarboxylase elated enzyme [Prochlorococcus marinus subsp. marinus str. CCMP1375]KGG19021.1 3-polyprenyl-4-hydroxybenzoate carboxy-lyase [Prochlorococcus marinus str. SS2]KGG23439.1 3-polyprenyl-4-hydroxybenzoate carboxy-lyase [Prochlorococcus marinus str. SS35]KGG32325.1 3-polyprenyl-4-hydroxybenzoate carboxy-lyase [Prochlorococcus marinus str. SS51]
MNVFQNGVGSQDMRDFLSLLEKKGQLRRISKPVDPDLELAAISDRVLSMGGPALLFENVIGSSMPVAINLLGTIERVVWSMGLSSQDELEGLGKKLSYLQQPEPPKGIKKTIEFGGILWDLLQARPDLDLTPPCHQRLLKGEDVNLDKLPLIRPWPGDAGKIITFGLVITKDPETNTPNVGVYRLQQQSINTMTVHWLSVRGGARHLRKASAMGKKLEVAIAIGVHPLILMAAATPIPVTLSEWLFAGLYAGKGVRLSNCKTVNLQVPSHSEIVLEGTIAPGEEMNDGPFGDHMGFYGGIEKSPLIRFHCITSRKDPIYLTTFSGRPPKEEAMLAIALNRIYTPILRRQINEITDFFLPMEALSYKLAIISIDKSYPGQARRAAMAFWSALPQFTYTKFVVVVDSTINVRDPRQVVWAISSLVDPQRDLLVMENTPFDSLDFASENIGLGGRLAIDATTKVGPEKNHEWGNPLIHSSNLSKKIDERWNELGLSDLKPNHADPSLFGYVIDEIIKFNQITKS